MRDGTPGRLVGLVEKGFALFTKPHEFQNKYKEQAAEMYNYAVVGGPRHKRLEYFPGLAKVRRVEKAAAILRYYAQAERNQQLMSVC